MSDAPNPSLGERNYARFARRYADRVGTKPHNALYERPATLSLLPDVAGMRVLDAGCGPGIYAEWLLDHGAEVVAVDITAEFVAIAQERLAGRDGVTILRADLTQPLTFAEDASFDLVLSSLVLHYIADWDTVFPELYRVLKPGGAFVFSVGHPLGDWDLVGGAGDYFAVEEFTMVWRSFGDPPVSITSYRRSVGDTINPLLRAGFLLDALLEPQPTAAFKDADPDDYAELMRIPGFLCVRARKPG